MTPPSLLAVGRCKPARGPPEPLAVSGPAKARQKPARSPETRAGVSGSDI